MKKIYPSIMLLVSSLLSYGQSLTQKEINGTWKVTEIVAENPNPKLQPLANSFKSATFNFSDNNRFEVSTTQKTDLFEMIIKQTQNSKWQFKEDSQYIEIGTEEDGYSTMGILVEKTEEKILFHFDETEITLAVTKS